MWDFQTGKLLKTITGYRTYFYAVAYSPDGETIASGRTLTSVSKIRLWDVQTGRFKGSFAAGRSSIIISLAYSPDGGILATGSHNPDGDIRLWEVRTGEQLLIGDLLKTLTEHTKSVNALMFSPDGSKLASGSFDNTIMLWDPNTGEHLKTLTGHSEPVYDIVFSLDGTRLVSGGGDDTIRVWDVETGELRFPPIPHFGGVRSLAFSPDGSIFGKWQQRWCGLSLGLHRPEKPYTLLLGMCLVFLILHSRLMGRRLRAVVFMA